MKKKIDEEFRDIISDYLNEATVEMDYEGNATVSLDDNQIKDLFSELKEYFESEPPQE